MKKETPMLFSTPMVIAANNETKTKTRRTAGLEGINDKGSDNFRFDGYNEEENAYWFELMLTPDKPSEHYTPVYCPYGKVGDLLWVRETFGIHKGKHEPIDTISYKAGNFHRDVRKKGYELHHLPTLCEWTDDALAKETKWKPSIHMKKEYARIWLEITSITIERLQDISEEDAKSEGIQIIGTGFKNYLNNPKILESLKSWDSAKLSFFSLWESINGVGSSDLNPWVWVIGFKKTTAPCS